MSLWSKLFGKKEVVKVQRDEGQERTKKILSQIHEQKPTPVATKPKPKNTPKKKVYSYNPRNRRDRRESDDILDDVAELVEGVDIDETINNIAASELASESTRYSTTYSSPSSPSSPSSDDDSYRSSGSSGSSSYDSGSSSDSCGGSDSGGDSGGGCD